MDTETLSGYGWVVIVILILITLLTIATPMGKKVNNDIVTMVDDACNTQKELINNPGTDAAVFSLNKNIPEGAMYFQGVTVKNNVFSLPSEPLGEGITFPELQKGRNDILLYQDYLYIYESPYAGWRLTATETIRKNENGTYEIVPSNLEKVIYSPIVSTINNVPVTNMDKAFKGCTCMESAPAIPNSVTSLNSTFNGCESLSGIISISNNVVSCQDCFANTKNTIVLTGNAVPEIKDMLKLSSKSNNILLKNNQK